MKSLIPTTEDELAFVLPGEPLKPVLYSQLQKYLKRMIQQTNRNPDLYSSHSFRRGGGASWAFKSQIPGELIQLHGDWASDAYKKYLEVPMSTRLLVPFKMTQSIKTLYK